MAKEVVHESSSWMEEKNKERTRRVIETDGRLVELLDLSGVQPRGNATWLKGRIVKFGDDQYDFKTEDGKIHTFWYANLQDLKYV